jgi:pilus assembly protein FimV
VYIAYGRDAQAEEILKEAMARDKGRHEIALKLLEIYHARKSATAFETVAKELRSSVGDDSPMWTKAAAMGAQIDPTNPLMRAAPVPRTSPALRSGEARCRLRYRADSTSASAPAPDFDLDLNTQKPDAGSSASASSALDFDIARPAPAPAADAPKEEAKPSFDFDLSGLDFPGSKPAANSGDHQLASPWRT